MPSVQAWSNNSSNSTRHWTARVCHSINRSLMHETYMPDGICMQKLKSAGYLGVSTSGMRPSFTVALKCFIAANARASERMRHNTCELRLSSWLVSTGRPSSDTNSRECMHVCTLRRLGDVELHEVVRAGLEATMRRGGALERRHGGRCVVE